jgi:hypothetical protein
MVNAAELTAQTGKNCRLKDPLIAKPITLFAALLRCSALKRALIPLVQDWT